MQLKDPVSVLKGVGPKKQAALKRLGIETIGDFLMFFPREYQDRRSICPISQLKQEQPVRVRAEVELVVKDPYRRGRRQNLRLLVKDPTGKLEIVFFQAGYLADSFKIGTVYDFYGKPTVNRGRMQMLHPDFSKQEQESLRGFFRYILLPRD